MEVLEYAKSSFYTQAKRITDQAVADKLTLRQAVERVRADRGSPFVGSPETVANEIQRWFDGRAFDGLNVHLGHPSQFARFVEQVVPILQARGLFRTEYEATTLRGNLGLAIPVNRHEVAAGARDAA